MSSCKGFQMLRSLQGYGARQASLAAQAKPPAARFSLANLTFTIHLWFKCAVPSNGHQIFRTDNSLTTFEWRFSPIYNSISTGICMMRY